MLYYTNDIFRVNHVLQVYTITIASVLKDDSLYYLKKATEGGLIASITHLPRVVVKCFHLASTHPVPLVVAHLTDQLQLVSCLVLLFSQTM